MTPDSDKRDDGTSDAPTINGRAMTPLEREIWDILHMPEMDWLDTYWERLHRLRGKEPGDDAPSPCLHDDGYLCGHRMRFAVVKIAQLLEGGR